MKRLHYTILSLFAIVCLSATSCVTAKKLDKFVAEQYNNEPPSASKPKNPKVTVINGQQSSFSATSQTVTKTSNMLPLIVFWHWKYSTNCTLNTDIAVNNFSKAINGNYYKIFQDKLNGQTLELTVEQVPSEFSYVDEANVIWLVYAFGWDKLYLHASGKDLVVSYKTLQNEQVTKSGKITVKNRDANKGLRFFQTWQSLISDHISDYNNDINLMAKEVAQQLKEQL